MTKESPERTARNGVAVGTNLVACLTWLETLFEHAPVGPKNARFGVVSHEIWPSKVSGLRDSGMLPPETRNDFLQRKAACCISLESYGQELSKMLRLVMSKAIGWEIWLSKSVGTSGLRECCLPGHRMFRGAYLPRESLDRDK